MGEEGFKENDPKSYYETLPPKIPVCFSFLFNVFLSLRNTTENGITYTELKSYCDVTHTYISQYDIELLFKMNAWANSMISDIRSKE